MIQVMIVEDEQSCAERYASYVADFGQGFVVCSICRMASQALEVFKTFRPDVVLSDIRMPGEDGLSMIEKIRKTGWCGQVVIVSGYDDFAYAQKAINLQAMGYLLKPVFEEDMNRTLLEVMSRLEDEGGVDSIEKDLIGPGYNSLPSFVKRAVRYISLNYEHHISLRDTASFASISSAHLSAVFKSVCGYSFIEYLHRYRLKVAKKLMETSDISLEEVAERVGMYDAAYFSKLFKRIEHITPGQYRKASYRNTRTA
ncbi:response regulator [Marispirochaeta sp.]|jgi:two-component system, response regulator YesN|uniref:response regulator transcription factor n=1 Tax=Marispirochaeta sp. TaxID=2038653 RepID=UPI0029C89D21|nr:helix-turn-helix domain-containing protein [Marispirochaeta sp.]